jgi:predicted metal-dependent phosphoesterase TrpH
MANHEEMGLGVPRLIIDIHTHTFPTSVDSFITADELIEEAKRIGLDGVCITDHDGFWDHSEVDELSKRHNFLVIPGCEVTTEDGHILVYGLKNYIFGMHRASFVNNHVEREGGAMVVAHPYRRTYRKQADTDQAAYYEMLERASRNSIFDIIDGVEVLNSRGTEEENAFSSEMAKWFDLPGTGASDAHRLEDLGTFATEFERDISGLDDLIVELKSGRFSPIVLSHPTKPHQH